MKKRITAVALGAIMTLSVATQALAAESPAFYDIMPISLDIGGEVAAEANNEALTRVTLAVKGALGIDDSYTSFSGSSSKTGALNYWSLNWSSDDGNITVRANDAGKVLSYNYYDSSSDVAVSEWSRRFSAHIQENSREDALEAAKAFVAPLLDENESIEWQTFEGVRELGVSSYFVAGTLMINGVKSPISINVNVRASDLVVTRFNRGDSYTLLLPEVPSADAPADISKAAEQLRGAYTLELQYVLGDDGQPVLRYVLTNEKELLVDAKTGELIDVAALRDAVREGGIGGADTGGSIKNEEAVADKNLSFAPSLSPVEEQAIAKLEGVKTIDELEKDARAIEALGLTGKFDLVSSSYSQVSFVDPDARDEDEEDVTEVYATLRFVRERRVGDDYYRTSKTVRLDARTGEFESVNGYSNEPVTLEEKVLTANAEAFAKEHAEHFDSYKLCDSDAGYKWYDGTYFTYYRHENGVPFKQDSISVSVDGSDGSIVSFSYNCTDDLTFPDTDGIVDMDAAIDAYFGAYTVELGYAELPTAVTPEDPRPLCKEFADAGYAYIYELRLVYGANREGGWLRGVDAKTGEAVITKNEPRVGITYSDVDTSYAAAIAKELGEYGIGYRGGKLNPTSSLNQLDMLCLLLAADGYEIPDEPTDEDINYFYTRAEWLGVTFDEKNPDAVVSRVEFVRTLIGMTAYGSAAKLEGIWAPGFADDAVIASGDIGYLAIAKALGIVKGDTDGSFHPSGAISRQDALIVLYNYMTK